MTVYTVSEINRYLKSVLDGDRVLKDAMIKGEISNFKRHTPSGHLYFTLKHEESSIRAVMFKRDAQSLRFDPENGLAVIVRGRITVFERDGNTQLYVLDILPDGIGARNLQFEQLKEKLFKEGLFDAAHKKTLPRFPQTIGLVTSKTGAALQDILHVLQRRYPVVAVKLASVLVQGEKAPAEIVRGIRAMDDAGCDVMIVGRGGGSAEDLAAFNDEGVARAIFAARTPIISAVGHEIDFSIADMVADLRAATPSAAAESATPDQSELLFDLDRLGEQMERSVKRQTEGLEIFYQRFLSSPLLRNPAQYGRALGEKADRLFFAIQQKTENLFLKNREAFYKQASVLDALSPLKVLSRGYALVQKEEKVIGRADKLKAGDAVTMTFADGVAYAQVTMVSLKEEGAKV